jgi:hypothetical protein
MGLARGSMIAILTARCRTLTNTLSVVCPIVQRTKADPFPAELIVGPALTTTTAGFVLVQ